MTAIPGEEANDPALREAECPVHGFRHQPEDCDYCENYRRYGSVYGEAELPDNPYIDAIREYRDWFRENGGRDRYRRIIDTCNAILCLLRDTPLEED